MTTQNINMPALRSSGHKEATEDHVTVAKMRDQGEGGDMEKLLQQRVLSNSQVSRAALYDEADFLCVGSSKQQFNVEPEDVRKILDGLLTFSRIGDPTAAGGNGEPPQHFKLGSDGVVNVKNGDNDRVLGELKGKTFIAARTAKFVLLLEGAEGASEDSLEVVVQSFQEGLQVFTL